jgi:hypothetical protein
MGTESDPGGEKLAKKKERLDQ